MISSLARYAEVIEAFLTGMEQARDATQDPSGIASVASFFVSRVDTEMGMRVDEIGTKEDKSPTREALARLRALAADWSVTLLTATKDFGLSQAAVLAELVREAA